MSDDEQNRRPTKAALDAKKKISKSIMSHPSVQMVGLTCTQEGDWRVQVTLLPGCQPPETLPESADGFAIDVAEDEPIVPHTAPPPNEET